MEKKPAEPETLVACEVCLKEVPASAVTSHEAHEYVHHFCGIECYARWQAKGQKTSNGKPKPSG